jgi:hypothetical protein
MADISQLPLKFQLAFFIGNAFRPDLLQQMIQGNQQIFQLTLGSV